MPNDIFLFKQFAIRQDRCALKVGTDGVLLGAWTDYAGARRVLDIGTGTGVLALIAAQRNGEALIDAVEIDDDSAEQAAENAAASPWADRVRVHRMDVRRLAASDPYDLIICNPPFYAGEMGSTDARTGLAKHSGELSFRELLAAIDRLLKDDGHASLIVPLNREKELLKVAVEHGFHPARRCMVRYLAAKPPKRVMLELRRELMAPTREEIVVEERAPFDYSPPYKALLSDLMLKF